MEPHVEIYCKKDRKKDCSCLWLIVGVVAIALAFFVGVLVAALTIRLVSPALMIVAIIALMLVFMYATPIMPKLYKEHSDDFNNMMFYAVLTLAIFAIVFYWGVF